MAAVNDEVLVIMSDLVATTRQAVDALLEGDAASAQAVIDGDAEFDALTLGVEERVLEIIATQYPVARDLRLLHSLAFIAMYEERMADLACNIAKAARRTAKREGPSALIDLIKAQSNLVLRVLDATREALEKRDLELALKLPELDEPVDALNKQFYNELGRLTDEEDIEWASKMVLCARYLERLADNAIDIGERLAYLITGERDLLEEVDPHGADRM
ncbi:MAG: phosphate signaling complex protein PhoU [Actinomycetes bacterium]|jgi:phosphate transport system protein|nr:phosphate signaling complex protein PhoU [Actinomycetes bacterium]